MTKPNAVTMSDAQADRVTHQIVDHLKSVLPDLVTVQIRAELDEWITDVTNEMNRLGEVVLELQAKLDGIEPAPDDGNRQ